MDPLEDNLLAVWMQFEKYLVTNLKHYIPSLLVGYLLHAIH
jgi:hypothetical protein